MLRPTSTAAAAAAVDAGGRRGGRRGGPLSHFTDEQKVFLGVVPGANTAFSGPSSADGFARVSFAAYGSFTSFRYRLPLPLPARVTRGAPRGIRVRSLAVVEPESEFVAASDRDDSVVATALLEDAMRRISRPRRGASRRSSRAYRGRARLYLSGRARGVRCARGRRGVALLSILLLACVGSTEISPASSLPDAPTEAPGGARARGGGAVAAVEEVPSTAEVPRGRRGTSRWRRRRRRDDDRRRKTSANVGAAFEAAALDPATLDVRARDDAHRAGVVRRARGVRRGHGEERQGEPEARQGRADAVEASGQPQAERRGAIEILQPPREGLWRNDKQLGFAEEAFRRIAEGPRKLRPNVYSYTNLLNACVRVGRAPARAGSLRAHEKRRRRDAERGDVHRAREKASRRRVYSTRPRT